MAQLRPWMPLVAEVAFLLGIAAVRLRNANQRLQDDPLLKVYDRQIETWARYAPGRAAPRQPMRPKPSVAQEARSVDREARLVDQEARSEAPGTSVHVACLPCSRAHLLMAKAALTEAARMAPRVDPQSPEILRRIDKAAEELLALERFDLEPQRIAALAPEERAVVEAILPRIAHVRQRLLNDRLDEEGLRQVAAEVADLYDRVRATREPLAAASKTADAAARDV